MPTTPTYSLPYPLATDPADVPTDMRELAEATETALTGFDTRDDAQDATLVSLDGRVDALEATPPGASDLTRIQDILLAANGAISFQSIPATYRNLLLVASVRGTDAGVQNLNCRINNDAGANYNYIGVQTTQTAVSPAVAAAATQFLITALAPTAQLSPTTVILDLVDYTGSLRKTVAWKAGFIYANAASSAFFTTAEGVWLNTAAVTRVDLLPAAGTFLTGSRATLYGLK